MKNDKSIYDLKFHEFIIKHYGTALFHITRVAGGWIYEHPESNDIAFVPYNNEFQNPENTSTPDTNLDTELEIIRKFANWNNDNYKTQHIPDSRIGRYIGRNNPKTTNNE